MQHTDDTLRRTLGKEEETDVLLKLMDQTSSAVEMPIDELQQRIKKGDVQSFWRLSKHDDRATKKDDPSQHLEPPYSNITFPIQTAVVGLTSIVF